MTSIWTIEKFDIAKSEHSSIDLYKRYHKGQKEICVGKMYNRKFNKKIIQREISILKHLLRCGASDQCIKYMGVLNENSDILNPVILMEYHPRGSLNDLKGEIGLDLVKKYMADLCMALMCLKKMKIVHRDIKLHNILLNDNDHAVLCDFGFAVVYDEANAASVAYDHSYTPNYAAPEIIYDNIISFATDVWGFGVCLYTLITGKHPFSMPLPVENTFERICNLDYKKEYHIDSLPLDIIEGIFVDVENRPSIEEIIEHPFFD